MKTDVAQLEWLDPKLREMILYLEDLLGVEFTNTSNWREDGVHSLGRGWDIRCNFDPFGEFIEDIINSLWEYDPGRPNMKCALYHDSGKGKHVHLQTHPNTRLR